MLTDFWIANKTLNQNWRKKNGENWNHRLIFNLQKWLICHKHCASNVKSTFSMKVTKQNTGEKNDAYCFSSETCGPVQVYLCNEYLSHSIRRKIVERNIMHWTRRKRRSIQCSRLIHTALNFLLDSMLIYNEIHHHNRREFISPP